MFDKNVSVIISVGGAFMDEVQITTTICIIIISVSTVILRRVAKKHAEHDDK